MLERLAAFYVPYLVVTIWARLLNPVVFAAWWWVRARLDRRHPDDLPSSAGELAVDLVRREGLAVEGLAHPKDGPGPDLFAPRAAAVVLSSRTHAKRDPTCWAVAAHEVGHARVYTGRPTLAGVLTLARQTATAVRPLCGMFLLAEVVLSAPEVAALSL